MRPSLLHKNSTILYEYCLKKFWGRTPRPPPLFKHIASEKSNIKTFKQLNTLDYVLVVCKSYAKHRKACPVPSTTPPPPTHTHHHHHHFFLLFCFAYSNLQAEQKMKINNLSRLNLPPPPTSGLMVVPKAKNYSAIHFLRKWFVWKSCSCCTLQCVLNKK